MGVLRKIFSVFVASPSDVEEEREALEVIIQELNIVLSKRLSAQLELLRWETHTFPEFGDHAQETIDRQIGDDYDVFIGIMWVSFGTETDKAASGTVGEFESAYDRFMRSGKKSPKIMMYFKDEPVMPSQLKPSDLMKIGEFRERIRQMGGRYASFTDIEDFRNNARIHLAQVLQELSEESGDGGVSETAPREVGKTESHPDPEVPEDDLGFLDLVEQRDEGFARINGSLEKLGNIQSGYADSMKTRTEEFLEISRDTLLSTAGRLEKARKVADQFAQDMDEYVARLRAEWPIYRENMSDTLQAISNLIAMSGPEREQAEVEAELQAVHGLREEMRGATQSLVSLRDATNKQTPLTKGIAKSKRKVLEYLNGMIRDLESSDVLLAEIEDALDS